MGFWDVLLFNIATVLGPRWIAAAGHNGTSSISLWVIAAFFFFVPGAFVINELSSRFPEEGGLYVWAKEAFGDFHGFVAGWTYWVYTIFYFPGLLLASASMSAYIVGEKGARLSQDTTFLLVVSLILLVIAVVLNIIGLNIGKWLQNAGGVGTYVPLLMLVAIAIPWAYAFQWPGPLEVRPATVGETLADLMASRGWPGAAAWAARADGIAPTIVGGSKKHGGPDLGPTRARLAWRELGVDGLGIADHPPGPDHPHGLAPKLTVRMVARLQGFPDSWQFAGRKTAAYRQVGNAFPPPVARAVGTAIAAALSR